MNYVSMDDTNMRQEMTKKFSEKAFWKAATWNTGKDIEE